jgi:hypothetical protein
MATMSAWLPACACFSRADYFTGRSPMTTFSGQAEIDGRPDALGAEQVHDLANTIDRLAVPGSDNVAQQQAGATRRSVRIDADDENATRVTRPRRAARCTFAPEGPKTRAEIAAKYLTPGQKLVDCALDRRRRNGNGTMTRSEDGHRHDLPMRTDQGAAFADRAQGEIKANEVVDGAAASAVPRPACQGDDAQRGQ